MYPAWLYLFNPVEVDRGILFDDPDGGEDKVLRLVRLLRKPADLGQQIHRLPINTTMSESRRTRRKIAFL